MGVVDDILRKGKNGFVHGRIGEDSIREGNAIAQEVNSI